jgi:hypothetical protein
LYDAEKNVGIAFLDTSLRNYRWNISREASRAFDEHKQNMTVGVFTDSPTLIHSPTDEERRWYCDLYMWSRSWQEEHGDIGYEEARAEIISEHEDKIRQRIIDNLTEQAQEFINRLKEEGVL